MSKRNRIKLTSRAINTEKTNSIESDTSAYSYAQKTSEINRMLGPVKDKQLKDREPKECKNAGSGSLLAGFVSIFAIVSVLTSLFGYGVVAGITHRFSHSQETLINSGFDLITMVWPGVLMIVTSLSEVLSFDLLIEVWKQTQGTMLAVVTIVFLAILGMFWLRPTNFANSLILRDRVKALIERKKTIIGSIGLALLGSILSLGTTFLFLIIGAFSIIVLFVLAIYIPILGYVSGAGYAQKFIVEPKLCATPSNRTTRLTLSATTHSRSKDENGRATCVLVSSIDPSKPFFRVGRTVLSSSSSIILWDPDSGSAYRTPLANMDISSIDENGFQQMSHLLARYPASCLSLSGDGRKLVLKHENIAADQCK